jgi:hypothetical protein
LVASRGGSFREFFAKVIISLKHFIISKRFPTFAAAKIKGEFIIKKLRINNL